MIRWTSTPIRVTVVGNTLAGANPVKVVIAQGSIKLVKSGTITVSGENAVIEVALTTSETSQFVEGNAHVQVMWKKTVGGVSIQSATSIGTISVDAILNGVDL